MSSAVTRTHLGPGFALSGTAAASGTFNQASEAGDFVVVAMVVDRAATTTVKWGGSGGTAMTLLGTVNNNNAAAQADGSLSYYGIANVAAGTATAIAWTSSATAWVALQSASYSGVGSYSIVKSAFGVGTSTLSQTMPALPSGCLSLQSFGFGCGTGSSPGHVAAGFTSPTGSTNLYNAFTNFGANVFSALTLSEDAAGGATFGVTVPSTAPWGSLSIILAPAVTITTGTPAVQATGSVLYENQAQATGCATSGSTGTTITWSQPVGQYATGITVAVCGDWGDGHSPGGGCPTNSAFTRTLTLNGTPMTLLGITDFDPGDATDGWVELWGICGSPVTSAANTNATLILNERYTSAPSTFLPELSVFSQTFSGLTAFGPTQVTNGNNAAPTCTTITSDPTHRVLGVMGSNVFSAGGGGGVVRYNYQALHYGNWAMLVEDAPASGSGVTLSATSGFGYWPAISIDLIPAPAPTTATVAITRGTSALTFTIVPSTATVALTGSTPTWTFSTSPFPPTATVSLTTGTPDVSNPVTVAPAGATVAITTGTPFTGNVTTASPTRASVLITTSVPTFTIVNSITATPTGAAVTVAGSTPTFAVLTLLKPATSTVTVTTGTTTVAGSTRLLAPTLAHVVVHTSTPGTFVAAPNTVTPGERTLIAWRAHRLLIPDRGNRTVIAAPTVY